ncbi:protein Niban 1a [Colossoma macropomum]|uniref:protein Niban 1a n=1 Tax=Colossoma macropomum TaxID=42526 RepID=UPI001864A943|nr:protein Niban 1a [Colossoma macropomum]
MGSSSSLLDENKSNLIKGRAQAELKNFAPFYKKQYNLAFLSHVHEELVQRKEQHTQLLKQREPPETAEVFYEDHVLYFDDNRKWKDRYAVVRANYSLECHESYESYVKGRPPLYKLLPTGGTVLIAEGKYMEMVDMCFPDANNVKEDFAPPIEDMPGDYPVYLRLPYRRDYYFCFPQEEQQVEFISALSDCIRHQNQDFLKKKTCEVQAFMKAIQLYRQEKGHYETWDMLIGSDVRVLANLIMEDLLPSLEKDLLPRLKAKKTEKRRTWFATVEAAYYLVQETLMVGMTALKDECKEKAKKQSALMRSDMDQIMSSRAFLESKLRATVAEPATKYCMEHVEPYLSAVLEELMGPISLGFKDARELSEAMMDQLYQDYQDGMTKDEVQLALVEMRKPNLHTCYEKVSRLKEHIRELQQSFSYSTSKGLEHSTQIDIQQLVENVAFTFELLLCKAEQENKDLGDAMVKAKHRVLKQYDYDSSTVRKRIFQEALINITLPSIKAHLAPTFKKELPTFEQYIFADYVSFINVENIYEDILQQILEKEVSKVVKEAASMKKYNLFMESRYNFSVSSLHSTPPGSLPGSPGHTNNSPAQRHAKPASPLLDHSYGGVPASEKQEAKTVEPEVAVAQRVEVQACPTQVQTELLEAPTGLQTGGGHKSEEKAVVEVKMPLSTGTETHIVHRTVVEEAAEATSAANESLNEGENAEVEPVTVTSLSTETSVDPPSLINVESITAAPQTLAEPVPEAVEPVANGTVNSSSAEKDTRPLDQVTQHNDTLTGFTHVIETGTSISSDKPGPQSENSLIAPEETEVLEDDPFDFTESETTPDVVPSDIASWVTKDEEVVENANEGDPSRGVAKPGEFVVVKCAGIADAEASNEAAAAEANFAPEASATTETAANPQPSAPESKPQSQPCPCPEKPREAPTVAPPVARPLDCIKEIRDLVVEVIEVEEFIQRYPDDGEV